MQENEPGNIRNDLLERLRNLEGPATPGSLAELSYRRAKEALEKALEEARNIRLQALEDARTTREREYAALMESLRQVRDEAQSQIDGLLRTAEIEAERIRARAESEALSIVERANAEASQVRSEAAAVRTAADERAKEVDRIESEFNATVGDIAKRLGIERPARGWMRFANR